MSVESDVKSFKEWAIDLSFHPTNIPTDEALFAVFKSRQRDVFCNLMKRVKSRQVVEHIRRNILIHKMKKFKDNVLLISIAEQAFMPLQLQNYFKYSKLKDKEEAISCNLETMKKEYDALDASIKKRSIKITNLKYKCELNEAKLHILEDKLLSLNSELMKEEDYKERLLVTKIATMESTKGYSNENERMEAVMFKVQKALKILQEHYKLREELQYKEQQKESNSNENDYDDENRSDVFNIFFDIKQLFKDIPNQTLFDALLCLKDEQLKQLMKLKLSHSDENNIDDIALWYSGGLTKAVDSTNNEIMCSEYHEDMMEWKSDIATLIHDYLKTKYNNQNMQKKFRKLNAQFKYAVLDVIKDYNTDNSNDKDNNYKKIIHEFIVQNNKRNFIQGQNEFLQQQINLLKMEYENNRHKLLNHDTLVNSLKELYGKVASIMHRLIYEIEQLPKVKERLTYCKKINECKLNDFWFTATVKTNLVTPKRQVHNTNNSIAIAGGDIFDGSLLNDVFCSTKLDFDSNSDGAGICGGSAADSNVPDEIFNNVGGDSGCCVNTDDATNEFIDNSSAVGVSAGCTTYVGGSGAANHDAVDVRRAVSACVCDTASTDVPKDNFIGYGLAATYVYKSDGVDDIIGADDDGGAAGVSFYKNTVTDCNSDTSLTQLYDTRSYVLELQRFNNLPLEYLNCVPLECQFYSMPNPLIIDSNELRTTVQLVPGILLTSYGLLEEVRKHIKWADVIANELSIDLILDMKPLNVKGTELKLKAQNQHKCISDLLDKITFTTINNQCLLQELNKMYAFLIKNPLGHFIPKSKLYNNRTYYDYESEFMTYYRLATSDSNIN